MFYFFFFFHFTFTVYTNILNTVIFILLEKERKKQFKSHTPTAIEIFRFFHPPYTISTPPTNSFLYFFQPPHLFHTPPSIRDFRLSFLRIGPKFISKVS